MRIPQKDQALSRYNTLKSKLQQAASKPENQDYFATNGDRVELTSNVSFSLDGQKVVIDKGSFFDNDIKTRDIISTRSESMGTVQKDRFEHFSERKGLIFKRDQEMLSVSYTDQQGFNHSNTSLTFEV